LLSLVGHECGVRGADAKQDFAETALFLVASIHVAVGLELGQQVAFLAEFTHFHVRLCVVAEEQLFVLRVCLNPRLKLRICH